MSNSIESESRPIPDELEMRLILPSSRLLVLAGFVASVATLHGLDLTFPDVRASYNELPMTEVAQNIYNPRMIRVIDLLSHSSATEQLPEVLIRNRVAIHFVPMSPGIYARYSVSRHVIEVDDRYMDGDAITLAAVVAHEGTHVKDAVSGYLASGGASACIDSEISAYKTSALFLLDQYPNGQKPDPQNALERQLNLIAGKAQSDPAELEDIIRQTYLQQCSH